MIRYKKVTDKGIEIRQIASRPTAYLDNWALNLLSADRALGDRFTDLLNELGGTLTISIINILEIVGRSDEKRVSDILRFVDSVDGVSIDIDPSRVVKREEKFRHIEKSVFQRSPCADLLLLRTLADVHNPLKPFKISEVILELQKEMKDDRYVIQEDFERELFPRITKARNDRTVLSRVKNRFKNKSERIKTEFPHTEHLLSRCVDFIVINESMKMPDKEWRDVFHVLVPVAYCDFVLIDSRWIAFVRSTGLRNPEIAKVYSQNELEKFLNDLEEFSE
jgi:hypothetical protein